MPDLSDKLREYMRKQKMSQAELSERSHISKTQISNILMKKACPRIDTIELICNALEINISCLFENDLYTTENIDGYGGLNKMDKCVTSINSMTDIAVQNSAIKNEDVILKNEKSCLIEFAKKATLDQLILVNQFIKALTCDKSS